MNNRNLWLPDPPSKQGVIDCKEDGTPIYQYKYLRLPARQTRFDRTLILIYCVIFIAAVCALFSLKKDSKTEDKLYEAIGVKGEKLSMALLTLFILLCLVTLFSIYESYWACYVKQKVECNYLYFTKTLCSAIPITIWIFKLKREHYALSFDYPKAAEMLFIGFCFLSMVVFLIAKIVQYQFCACKTCKNIKDVKIRHRNKIIELAETDKITDEFLFERFKVPREQNKLFSLQFSDGTDNHRIDLCCTPIQLHEGDYILKYGEAIPSSMSRTLAPSMPLLEEEVHLYYQKECKTISNKKRFTQTMLRNWFDIESNATISIKRLENGLVIHTFNDKEIIILEGGTYEVVMFNKTSGAKSTMKEKGKPVEYTILTVD